MLGVAFLAVFISDEVQFGIEFWFQEPAADLINAKMKSFRSSFWSPTMPEAGGD